MRCVPLGDQRTQLVHHLPCTLDVERIEFVHRHAVSEQRRFELRRGAALEVERAPAGKVLGVPHLCPVTGVLRLRHQLAVVDDVERVDPLPERILQLQLLRDLGEPGLVHGRILDGFEQVVLEHRLHGRRVGHDHVPAHVAALDHRLDLGRFRRRIELHGIARRLLECGDDVLAQRRVVIPAPAHHDQLALVRASRPDVKERTRQRRRGDDSRGLQNLTSLHCLPPCVHPCKIRASAGSRKSSTASPSPAMAALRLFWILTVRTRCSATSTR